jgi:hypothetical protein
VGCGAVPIGQITNLAVSDGANAGAWSVQSNLQVGATVYGDRTYTIASLPAPLAGGNWIRAANASKAYAGSPLASFTLPAASDVYIAFDNRAAIPSWVDAGWADTGNDLTTSENGTTRAFSVYKKRFNAGSVTLGPVNNGGISMYVVVVR